MIAKIPDKIVQFFRTIYLKLVIINDTPQKIAQGFGLGVFLGVFPGAGLLAALILSSLFKMNKAGALLGIVLTNTWLSIVTFLLSVKIGAVLTGSDWQNIKDGWNAILQNFQWLDVIKLSALKIIAPVMLGYLSLSVIAGISAYFVAFIIVRGIKHRHAAQADA